MSSNDDNNDDAAADDRKIVCFTPSQILSCISASITGSKYLTFTNISFFYYFSVHSYFNSNNVMNTLQL